MRRKTLNKVCFERNMVFPFSSDYKTVKHILSNKWKSLEANKDLTITHSGLHFVFKRNRNIKETLQHSTKTMHMKVTSKGTYKCGACTQCWYSYEVDHLYLKNKTSLGLTKFDRFYNCSIKGVVYIWHSVGTTRLTMLLRLKECWKKEYVIMFMTLISVT